MRNIILTIPLAVKSLNSNRSPRLNGIMGTFISNFQPSVSNRATLRTESSRRWTPWSLAFIASLSLATTSIGCAQSAADETHNGDSKNNIDKALSLADTKEFLKAALEPFRQTLRNSGRHVPHITLNAEGDEHSCTFTIPQNADPISVLSSTSKALQAAGHSLEVHSAAPGLSFSLVLGNNKGSVLLRWSPAGGGGGGGGGLPPGAGGGRPGPCSLHLYKTGGFTRAELRAVRAGYEAALAPPAAAAAARAPGVRPDGGGDRVFFFGPAAGPGAAPGFAPLQRRTGAGDPTASLGDPLDKLRALGAGVFEKGPEGGGGLDWDSLAGYDYIKREVEDTIILALKHPEAYDSIARKTRQRFESNRPRAILFEGPPGTGKTLTARIIANRADKPMVHVNVESIMSKWYGESEKKLAQIFEACDELGGAIIFIDEIDALATSRDTGQMHEATRRVLSVVLQRIEGFRGGGQNTLVCATNRRQDLDAALLNRYDLTLRFDLPDPQARAAILARYARHLAPADLRRLAGPPSEGLAARDLKEAAEQAERARAAALLRKEATGETPSFDEYMKCIEKRQRQSSLHQDHHSFSQAQI